MRYIIILLTILLYGCEPNHDFLKGQCVVTKLDNLKGMVIYPKRHNIWVRFSVIRERTNTHLIAPDEDIEKAPYAMVRMSYFELDHCENQS